MEFRDHARRLVTFAVGLALAYVGWVFLHRHLADLRWTRLHESGKPADNKEFEKIYGGSGVRILQFYARDGVVTEGDRTVICYGVLNARSVRITPAIDGVGVSANRCVDAAPEKETRYTLTAEGVDGRSVSASLELNVVPDPATLPKITSFRIAERKKDYLGHPLFVLSYADQNGEVISIDPPVFSPIHGAPYGRFYVRPDKTTTYTLRVTGKRGHFVEKQLTVEVPESRK